MAKTWQNLNLEGGGLQAVNAALTRRLRSRTRTFLAWLGFPLGLHRFYLGERRGGFAYLTLTLVIIALISLSLHPWWALPAVASVAAAIRDLTRLETLRAQYNKNLRMQLFLRKGEHPPADYRGRYLDTPETADAAQDLADYTAIKERERAGHPAPPVTGPSHRTQPTRAASRLPSFNEQEALLRAMQQRKKEQARQ